jgi:hypothetical protein
VLLVVQMCVCAAHGRSQRKGEALASEAHRRRRVITAARAALERRSAAAGAAGASGRHQARQLHVHGRHVGVVAGVVSIHFARAFFERKRLVSAASARACTRVGSLLLSQARRRRARRAAAARAVAPRRRGRGSLRGERHRRVHKARRGRAKHLRLTEQSDA